MYVDPLLKPDWNSSATTASSMICNVTDTQECSDGVDYLYNRIASTSIRDDEVRAFEAAILSSQAFLEAIQRQLDEDVSVQDPGSAAKRVTKELERVVIRECEFPPEPPHSLKPPPNPLTLQLTIPTSRRQPRPIRRRRPSPRRRPTPRVQTHDAQRAHPIPAQDAHQGLPERRETAGIQQPPPRHGGSRALLPAGSTQTQDCSVAAEIWCCCCFCCCCYFCCCCQCCCCCDGSGQSADGEPQYQSRTERRSNWGSKLAW